MEGWIKIHRQIIENEIYFSEPFTRTQARIDLLITTSYKPGIIMVRGNLVKVERGQNGYSEDSLAKRRQWSRKKVRRFLNYLEAIQQIEQQKSKVKSVITIVNYEKYQQNDTTDDTTERHQTIQQTDTIKKDKKEKKEKEDIVVPEFLKPTYINFLEMRTKIKKPPTGHAQNLLLNKLSKIGKTEQQQIKILEKSIINGRQDVYPLKEEDMLDDPIIFKKRMDSGKYDDLKRILGVEKFFEMKGALLTNTK